jgi:hypothetical protein
VPKEPCHKPKPFEYGSVNDSRGKFMRKLEKVKKAIIRAAKGRVCGDCKFYFRFGCSKFSSEMTGSDLECHETSVACKSFEVHDSTP